MTKVEHAAMLLNEAMEIMRRGGTFHEMSMLPEHELSTVEDKLVRVLEMISPTDRLGRASPALLQ